MRTRQSSHSQFAVPSCCRSNADRNGTLQCNVDCPMSRPQRLSGSYLLAAVGRVRKGVKVPERTHRKACTVGTARHGIGGEAGGRERTARTARCREDDVRLNKVDRADGHSQVPVQPTIVDPQTSAPMPCLDLRASSDAQIEARRRSGRARRLWMGEACVREYMCEPVGLGALTAPRNHRLDLGGAAPPVRRGRAAAAVCRPISRRGG